MQYTFMNAQQLTVFQIVVLHGINIYCNFGANNSMSAVIFWNLWFMNKVLNIFAHE